MTTNDRSQIIEDVIDQLEKFQGKVKDVLDGVERWLPEDHPHKTPKELAALRKMEKLLRPRKYSLYSPKELTAILKEDKLRCWHKANILFSKNNFNSIKRITKPRWPTEWSIFKESWDEIDAIFERGPNTNSFERDTSGRFRPGCAASEPFLHLIRSLNCIIGKLTEQSGSGEAVEYSLPLTLKKWGYILGLTPNKLRQLRGTKYHFDKVHSRGWRLPKHEIPTEYLERYRQQT